MEYQLLAHDKSSMYSAILLGLRRALVQGRPILSVEWNLVNDLLHVWEVTNDETIFKAIRALTMWELLDNILLDSTNYFQLSENMFVHVYDSERIHLKIFKFLKMSEEAATVTTTTTIKGPRVPFVGFAVLRGKVIVFTYSSEKFKAFFYDSRGRYLYSKDVKALDKITTKALKMIADAINEYGPFAGARFLPINVESPLLVMADNARDLAIDNPLNYFEIIDEREFLGIRYLGTFKHVPHQVGVRNLIVLKSAELRDVLRTSLDQAFSEEVSRPSLPHVYLLYVGKVPLLIPFILTLSGSEDMEILASWDDNRGHLLLKVGDVSWLAKVKAYNDVEVATSDDTFSFYLNLAPNIDLKLNNIMDAIKMISRRNEMYLVSEMLGSVKVRKSVPMSNVTPIIPLWEFEINDVIDVDEVQQSFSYFEVMVVKWGLVIKSILGAHKVTYDIYLHEGDGNWITEKSENTIIPCSMYRSFIEVDKTSALTIYVNGKPRKTHYLDIGPYDLINLKAWSSDDEVYIITSYVDDENEVEVAHLYKISCERGDVEMVNLPVEEGERLYTNNFLVFSTKDFIMMADAFSRRIPRAFELKSLLPIDLPFEELNFDGWKYLKGPLDRWLHFASEYDLPIGSIFYSDEEPKTTLESAILSVSKHRIVKTFLPCKALSSLGEGKVLCLYRDKLLVYDVPHDKLSVLKPINNTPRLQVDDSQSEREIDVFSIDKDVVAVISDGRLRAWEMIK